MNRFYVKKSNIGSTSIKIADRDDVHHLVRVLRVGPGEDIFVSDGDGGSYIGTVDEISKNSVSLRIKERLKKVSPGDKKINITLAVAIPRNTRFEDIVDKATQLGVDALVPLFTHRTLVALEGFEKKRERLRRIIVSAAKQSGVLFLPELKESISFLELLKTARSYDLCLLPNLSGPSLSLSEVFQPFGDLAHRWDPLKILVLIGPEGDFTPDEIKAGLKAHCQSISLGDSVLRVDTAAIAVLSFLKFYQA